VDADFYFLLHVPSCLYCQLGCYVVLSVSSVALCGELCCIICELGWISCQLGSIICDLVCHKLDIVGWVIWPVQTRP